MRRSIDGYIIEITRIGAYAKVAAVCPQTGTEVSVSGPARGADEMLTRTAIRKLEARLAQLR